MGPEVEGQGDEIVHVSDGPGVERHVDRLHVPLAGFARLDADRLPRLVVEVGELVRILLPAARTLDPHELPLAAAQGTAEVALPALQIRLSAPGRHPRQPGTE